MLGPPRIGPFGLGAWATTEGKPQERLTLAVTWAPPKVARAMEELQRRLRETLDVLSPQELSNFRAILKKVDEEPRVSPVQLELEGRTASGLAGLLAKHYYLQAAPRVLTKVLKQLPRADLLPRWQSDPTAYSQGERGDDPAAHRVLGWGGGQGGYKSGGSRGAWGLVPPPRGFPGRSRGGAGSPGERRGKGRGNQSKEDAGVEGPSGTAARGGSPGVSRQESHHSQARIRVSSGRVAIRVY